MSRDGQTTLVAAFDDIDRMSVSVRSHADYVRSCIGKVASVAVDPDFAVSLPLSPFTGTQAGNAVAVAVGRLTVHLASAEGVALVSATIVSTYRLTEAALALAAGGLGATAGVVGSSISHGVQFTLAGVVTAASAGILVGTVVLALRLAVDSVIAGFVDEFVDSLGPGLQMTVDEYAKNPALLLGGGALFGKMFGSNTGSAFAMNDVFANAILRLESSLGATGPFFDDILRALIASGNNLGFFIDTEAELGPSGLSEIKLARVAKERAEKSSQAVFGSIGAFRLDSDGRVLPSNVASLFASGRQIDDIGKDSFAAIRIITCTDDDGRITGYTVQIPSTQSALPWRVGAPNDLTADLHAMVAGSQTALAQAVLDAMKANGIQPGSDGPPILISGFSLGGITAAAIASDVTGFNIRQVVTAGSPIGSFEIPDQVRVLALEANQDPVCALDGKPNPSGWTTIRHDAFALANETSLRSVGSDKAHDLDRYARMAAAEPNVNSDSEIASYFEGNLTINDYYAKAG